ncbi:UNVERIFIED_CONTAM: hypothetical protein K2H54_051196 [Gekko kuhli]
MLLSPWAAGLAGSYTGPCGAREEGLVPEDMPPCLQDLAAKIAALERAKATKHKRDKVVTPMVATAPRHTRATARKQEFQALYAQLAQLHESDEDDGETSKHTMKAKIWWEEYVEMFTLLFRDVEVKASVKELEKIQRMQVDKNFDNWLSVYTVYMGEVLQAYPDRGSVLVKYQDLIHCSYKEYNGAALLCYDELFRA